MEETSEIIKGVDWELFFFLRAFFLGFSLRMGYDFFLISRRLWKHHGFWITVEDFIFWMTGSILMFGLLFKENNGTPRLFALLGVLAGMILYHVGPSPCVLSLFQWIQKLMKKVKIRLKNRVMKIVDCCLHSKKHKKSEK